MTKEEILKNTQSHNGLTLTNVRNILNLTKEAESKTTQKLKKLINETFVNFSTEKTRIFKKHDIDKSNRFNIFESISDKWYRENFHSDILYTLLNPKTIEIGRKCFVKEFVKFLGIEDRFDCDLEFEVVKEAGTGKISWTGDNGESKGKKGFIDLLIKNDREAIIIENKINYAPDMKNQLVRYMKYVKETLGIETCTVVYLTLIDDKKPPLDSYDKGFEEYAKLLNDKNSGVLKQVYAVNEKKSLEKDFLPECLALVEKYIGEDDACSLASVYINQYKVLLEHLGGKAYMLSTEKKLVEEIYSNKEKFEAALDFVDFWNNRKTAITEVLKDKIHEKFSKEAVTQKKLHDFKDIDVFETKKDDVLIYFSYDDNKCELGFTSTEGKTFSKTRQNELFELIKKIPNKAYEEQSAEWVYCKIKDSATLIDDLMKAFEILFSV